MYYLKDNDGNLLKIAKNEKEFINSLFNPEGTCSGYIKKIYKHSVFFMVHNREYCLNKFGVILSCSILNGKKWYQLQLQFAYASQHEFRDSLAIRTNYFDYKDVVYYYK